MLQPKWWVNLLVTVFCTMIAIFLIKKAAAKVNNQTLNSIVNEA